MDDILNVISFVFCMIMAIILYLVGGWYFYINERTTDMIKELKKRYWSYGNTFKDMTSHEYDLLVYKIKRDNMRLLPIWIFVAIKDAICTIIDYTHIYDDYYNELNEIITEIKKRKNKV